MRMSAMAMCKQVVIGCGLSRMPLLGQLEFVL